MRAIIWCAVSTTAQSEPEHYSLLSQEADARAFAEAQGYDIIDTLIVPGHSRNYKDIHNTHEPVYTGAQADEVKAEIFRRMDLRGKAKPAHTYMFTGLFVCGYNLGYYTERKSPQARKMYCVSHWNQSETRPDCDERVRLKEPAAQDYFDSVLRQMLTLSTPDIFAEADATVPARRIEQLEQEVNQTKTRIQRLIVEQSSTNNPETIAQYREVIQQRSEQLKILRRNLDESRQQAANKHHQTQG